jgi:two-component sensor histidine kinase
LRQAQIQKARDDAEAEVHASRDRYAALAAEREVLLREVNHRVGNSLQIIASLLHLQGSTGLGQKIIHAMATKLDATLLHDPAHAGTRVVLTFAA